MPYYQTHNYLEVKNQFTSAGIIRIIPQKINIKRTNYDKVFIINSGIVIIDITKDEEDFIKTNVKTEYKPNLCLPEIVDGQHIVVINLTSFHTTINSHNNGKDQFLDNNINTTTSTLRPKSSTSFISAGLYWITV